MVIFLVIIAFFISRLLFLDKFPIFSDEGIYIKWAKTAWQDASLRFISLTDGRQPLQTWATIPFLKLFPENSLLAGRLFAVFSGLTALVGIFFLSYYLFGKKTALISSLLYVLTPLFLFFDRIALVDSLVNSAFVWITFLSLILAKTLRLDIALILGLVTGLFLLAKSSVFLFLIPLFISGIIFFDNKKNLPQRLINFFILTILSLVIALAVYNVQRLSPYLHYVSEKNKTFILTVEEWVKNPFQVFWHNFRYIPYYVAHSLGYASFSFGLFGLIILFRKKTLLAAYLLFSLIMIYLLMSFFMKILSTRYVIFYGSVFIILTGYFLSLWLKRVTKKKIVFLITCYIFTFYFSYTIIIDFKNIPFAPFPHPSVDRGQYIEGWPAGWGIREFIEQARKKAKEKQVIIIAEGNFGMAGDVLEAHLKPSDRIKIKSYWPIKEENLKENQPLLINSHVYVFFAHRETFPDYWPIKLVRTIEKPSNRSRFYIFELTNKR
ncbi:MAG: glycosyltransferase family 39 protein [Patescibacteria group bacterium]|nr:glycosyltransferase family 39 protein [Patescibacteria group bacterium]